MKKILLFISFTLFLGSIYAQQGLKLGIFVGPQLGYHSNSYDQSLASPVYQNTELWGLHSGVSVGYHFVDMFGVKVQAVYSQQGNSYLRTIRDVETRFVDRLDYLKIPLLLGFNTSTDRRKTSFSLFVGPQIAFLSRVAEYDDNPDFGLIEGTQDSKLVLEQGEELLQRPGETLYIDQLWGFVGEIGIDVQLPPDNLVLNLRIRQDLSFDDLENKDVTATTYKDGVERTFSYWKNAFGAINTRNAATSGMTTALTVGITYTFRTGEN